MVILHSKHLKTILIYVQATKLPLFMKNQWDIQVESVGWIASPLIGIRRQKQSGQGCQKKLALAKKSEWQEKMGEFFKWGEFRMAENT